MANTDEYKNSTVHSIALEETNDTRVDEKYGNAYDRRDMRRLGKLQELRVRFSQACSLLEWGMVALIRFARETSTSSVSLGMPSDPHASSCVTLTLRRYAVILGSTWEFALVYVPTNSICDAF